VSVDPEQSKCVVCGSNHNPALICPVCKLPADTEPCGVCRKPIPKGADYCNDCKTYQKLPFIPRSMLGLSLVTTLIAVITPAITAWNWVTNYDSHTRAVVVRAHRAEIAVYLWNTGRNPSAVLDVGLHYSGVPLQDVAMVPAVALTRLIKPNDTSTIILSLPEPMPKQGAPPRTRNASANLSIVVQESDGEQRTIMAPLQPKFIDDVLSQPPRADRK